MNSKNEHKAPLMYIGQQASNFGFDKKYKNYCEIKALTK